MNHKRRRPKSRRAGCLMCKHWKVSGSKLSDQLRPSENRLIQEESPPIRRTRRDRRRWCRGKEGVEHDLVCLTYEEAKGQPRYPDQAEERFLVCRVCGKELKHFWGQRYPVPEWVTR